MASRTGNEEGKESASTPTSYDVARLAGVSQSAVSRCFSPGASISRRTRFKVEQAAKKLGYAPDPLARSLITRRSGLVGLVVTMATLRNTPQLLHDMSDTLRSVGFLPLLTTLDDERDLAQVWPSLLGYRPEAIVSLATASGSLVKAAKARDIPVLFVNRSAPRGVRATSIRCDHAGATASMVQSLTKAGHRRLAFVAGPLAAPVSQERLAGFHKGLEAANLSPVGIVHADYSYTGGANAARTLLAAGTARPDAILCANDMMAFGVIDHCRIDAKVNVPGDVSVTGFDNVPEAARPTTALTTVEQPTGIMARLLVDTLLELRSSPDAAGSVHLIPGTIRWRGSSNHV